MRRFNLVRVDDVSGNSGVGVVAEGAEFTNGKAMMTWFGGNINRQSIAIYDSVSDLIDIHGHGGRTRVEYIDPSHDSRDSRPSHCVAQVSPSPVRRQARRSKLLLTTPA